MRDPKLEVGDPELGAFPGPSIPTCLPLLESLNIVRSTEVYFNTVVTL